MTGAESTFIGRHGLVAYNEHLTYPRLGPCELGICLARAEADAARAARELAEAEARAEQARQRTAALAARRARLDAWRPRLDSTKSRKRRELLANTYARRTATYRQREAEDSLRRTQRYAGHTIRDLKRVRGARLIFDHCHAHGWVRGLVCLSCNVRLGSADAFAPLPYKLTPAEVAAFADYRARCPECCNQVIGRFGQ